jgi:hypothetical protein
MTPTIRARRCGDLMALLPVAIAVLGFYAWTVGSGAPEPMVAPHQGDYYNLLVDGMVEGHLYLKVGVDPALLLPPAQRPAGGGDALLDASLYRGHYYLYFGVAPALTFFLPFRLLTGLELNQLVVVGLQGAAAFLAGLALLLVLRRRFAPASSRWSLAAAALAWGLGSALPVALRKPHMYEVAITAGLAWSLVFLLGAVQAVLRPARAGRWLALASLGAGLAAASRPNLLCGTLALGGVLGWLLQDARRAGTLSPAGALRWIAAAVGPAAVAGAGLLLYNYRRFGDALEFGHRYQMGSSAEGFFSARYLWHNLQLYYLTPPAASWLFPFFAQGREGPRPAGYIGVEPLHGQFFCLLWFGVLALAVAAWRRRTGARDPQRRRVGAVFGWWFGANFLLLACTSVRANRYLLDFHPALVLAGCLLWLEAATLPARVLRRLAVAAGAAGIAVVGLFNAGISVETMGRMRLVNPVGYARLERACNRLVWPIFRLTAPAFGPRAFQVVFPAAPPRSFEPLLSLGSPLNGASLLVHYLEPGRAELLLGDELTSDNPIGGSRGPVFATTPGRSRQLTVDIGALYPPIGHPWFGAASDADMQRRATTVRVALEGTDVLRVSERPHPVSPGEVRIGWSRPWASAAARRFSGRLRALAEPPPQREEPIPPPGAGWGYRLELRLPRDRYGEAEPLVTTGIRPGGDAIFLRYRDPRAVEIIHDEIGGGLRGSVVLPVDYGRPQAFEIWFDPAPAGPGPSRYRLSIFHEGQPVLQEKTPLQAFAYGEEAIGANVVGSSVGRGSFGGAVLALARTDSANVSRHIEPERRESSAAVRFRLPPASDARSQPLLLLSRADGGQGLLSVRRAGASLEIGWRDAAGWWWSRPLAEPAEGSHTVGLQWTLTDREPAASGAARPDALGVMFLMDGVICRPPRLGFFSAPISQVSAWHDPWPGDPATAEHFAGSIESAPPLPRLLETRAALRTRHFQLAVRFPADRAGGSEPLVTAGPQGRADGLYVRYERAGWVRLGFDHWGTGGPLSAAVPVAAEGYEILEVAFGDGPWTAADRAEIVVMLHGRAVLRAPADFYATTPEGVAIGANPAGLSTSGRAFGGEIFPVADPSGPP